MKGKKILSFNINTACNLRCVMCGIPSLKREEMTTQQIKKMFEDLPKLGFRMIFLAGGEPLLRRDICEIIAYGNKLNIKIIPATNGTLISEEVAKALAKCRVYTVTVSIDGPKEIHDKFRGKGVFERMVNGIKNLRKFDIPTTMAMTIMKPNYMYMCDIVDLAHGLGVGCLIFQPYCQYPGVDELITGQLKLDLDDIPKFRKELVKAIDLIKTYKMNTVSIEFLSKFPEYFLNDLKIEPVRNCLAIYKSLVVEADGSVYPCFGLENYKLGNVKEESLLNIWNSEKHEKVRAFVKEGKCRGCLLTCYDYIFSDTHHHLGRIFLKKIFPKLYFLLKNIKTKCGLR